MIVTSPVLLILAALAADASPLGDAVSTELQKYLAARPHAGVVIGIIQPGEQQVLGYGQVTEEPLQFPDGNTLYEIGSITKVYTGLLLAEAVAAGQVSLDDDLARLLPDVKLSQAAGRVTLKQLATHTSGLPRLPWNLYLDTATRSSDPYSAYSRERLDAYLQTAKIEDSKIGQVSYSNLGVGLLGDLLARRAGLSYEELVKRDICQPLGLVDTFQNVPDEARERLIRPMSRSGEVVSYWTFDALAGAGGLRSSVKDQLKFLSVQLNPSRAGPLQKAVELSQQVQVKNEKLSLGLCWHIHHVENQVEGIYWHNGGTLGFKTFMAFHVPSQTAIVILSNSGDAISGDMTITGLGIKLIEFLVHKNSEV